MAKPRTFRKIEAATNVTRFSRSVDNLAKSKDFSPSIDARPMADVVSPIFLVPESRLAYSVGKIVNGWSILDDCR